MKLVGQSFEIINPLPNESSRLATYRAIVEKARVAYRGEYKKLKITEEALGPSELINKYGSFIRNRIMEGHFNVLEHATMSICFTTNRAIANELTRHRMMVWTQESTRYCNYGKESFGGEVSFVYSPYFIVGTAGFDSFTQACEKAEKEYFALLNIGYSPEQARDVLPLATKTTLVGTANMNEWRHIFSLRADESTGKVHPMMKHLMVPVLKEVKTRLPDIFFDIGENDEKVRTENG